ncbi:MAG: hypothetical protein EA400_05145 [Chromatiaceae bacterium]|nr:MAG: hypothetical protein EA400_05145 [Chromatiaceae bacterium]
MVLRLLLLLLVLLPGLPVCAPASPAAAELAIATWNIEHLAAADGAGCRPRGEADYAILREVVVRLGADIIALQEIENADAAARVFPPDRYDLVISPRPVRMQQTCRHLPGQRRSAQRTGFAIDRERLASLGLRYRALPPFQEIGVGGRRWGTRIAIEPIVAPATAAPASLELIALHLKSGCAWGRLGDANAVLPIRRTQCLVLRRQRGILQEWIDARAAAAQPFVLLGDFNRQLDQRNDDFWQAIADGAVCDWQPHADLGRRCRSGTSRPSVHAELVLVGAGQPFPYPYNPRFPYAIDHLVLGGPARDWLRPDSYRVQGYEFLGRRAEPPPSDHHPIRAALRLPWPAP